jgi:methyl-accepting chemotaxis protein
MARLRFPLVTRIAFFFGSLMLIMFGVFMLVLVPRVSSALDEYSSASNLALASARAAQLGALVDKLTTFLKPIAGSPQARSGDIAGIVGFIDGLKDAKPSEIDSMNYFDSTGTLISAAGRGADISDRDYFVKTVVEGGDSAIGSPVISRTIGVPVFVMARAVAGAGGRAMIAAQVRLEDLSKVAGDIKVGSTGYGWIMDGTGLVLAHEDKGLIMKQNVLDTAKDGYSGYDGLGKAMLERESGSASWRGPDGVAMTTYFARIPSTPGWSLGISLQSREVARVRDGLVVLLVILVVAGIVASIGLSILIAGAIAKPLKLAAGEFRSLAEGDADLTASIAMDRGDEIGDLVRDFNAFLGKLRNIVGSMKAAQGQLAAIGRELGADSAMTSEAAALIAERTESSKARVESQAASVSESSSAVEQIAKNIENLDRLISTQSVGISEASASIEQMVHNIASISTSSEKMAAEFEELSSAARDGKESLSASVDRINHIGERSGALDEANRAISSIASQTNLLAMNAAIEAAHAGEAGRGFSVVADEIRKLSETSAGQSKAISQEIALMSRAIEEITESIRLTDAAFVGVDGRIAETERLVAEVRQAISEQKEGSSQILEALKGMNEVTQQVREGSAEMNSGNVMILEEMNRLRDGARELADGMKDVAEGGRMILESAEGVAGVAERTRSTIADMDAAVGRFKV